MKKLILLTQFTVSLVCTNAIAMENFSYQHAINDHTQRIVEVINKDAISDSTKIVILPKKFREMAVKEDINKGRLYCATTASQEVIAFKKLFIIKDELSFNNIATNEIRCMGDNSRHVATCGIFSHNNSATIVMKYLLKRFPFSFKNSAVIYFGGDYTVQGYRNQKINSHLTRHAFDSIKNDTVSAIKANKFEQIVLLYGLTKANAGQAEDGIDRTPSIVRAFKQFSEQIFTEVFNIAGKQHCVIHSQYDAFMPTFDPESTECIPLSDDKAIAGYGNVLLFSLNK